MLCNFFVWSSPHNLGCSTVRASDGPCNACATNASVWWVSAATTTLHHDAAYATLLLAKVFFLSLLRPLYGQMRQLQTNNPWQITCNTRLAHTLLPQRISEPIVGLVGTGFEDRRHLDEASFNRH